MMAVFLALLALSAVTVFYTYFAYPAWVRWMAGDRIDRDQTIEPMSDADCPHAAFLMTAHNEQAQIVRKIDNCLAQDYPASKLRVVVVSDGCTDDTVALIKAISGERVELIESSQRIGKAACINLAMQQIEEPFIIFADVRQRLSEDAARHLLGHFSDPQVGAVTGELELERVEELTANKPFGRGVSDYWQLEVGLRRAEAAVHSVVGATGALYALRRAAFSPIPVSTILDDVLIPMNAVMSGFRVNFESRARAYDLPVSDQGHERRRKIRTLAGNFQLLRLRPQLLHPRRNPIFAQFVSHKLMRLLVPLAMLVALVSSAVLSTYHWVFLALFLLQVVAYTVSALPEQTSRLLSVGPLRMVRTFVLMHWFVVLGFVEFVANRDAHLWDVSSNRVQL